MCGCIVDGGGYVEDCGLRAWAEFPLVEFAGSLFTKHGH